jgi:hypothetical protein
MVMMHCINGVDIALIKFDVVVQMAVFMGCNSGEMEIGLSSNTSPAAVADHVQQSLMELMQMPPTLPPSSSSSSLPSLSIGNPEYSSLIRSMTTATAAEPSSSHPEPLQLPRLLPPVYGHASFSSSEAEDAAMAQVMLAVIASSAPPSQEQRSSPRRGAFKAYSAALSPRARPRPGSPAQRMVKTAIALMVRVHVAMRDRELATARRQEDVAAAQPPQPTSSQLHHMISERRRRERLNESFETLRALLPPGSKVHHNQPLLSIAKLKFAKTHSNFFRSMCRRTRPRFLPTPRST